MQQLARKTRRGDSIIEVMFAITIFSLVAVLAIAMMNAGIAASERSLELVTARAELNAQAEALRFIHSSYVSELTLPLCSDLTSNQIADGEKCQQFANLWQTIINHAMDPYDPNNTSDPNNYSIPSPLDACKEVYDDDNRLLRANNAFVLNTRQISYLNNSLTADASQVYVSSTATATADLFQPATLNARLVYIRGSDASYDEDSGDSSVDVLSTDPLLYRKLGRIEGIWAVAVREANGRYYDFYIQTCWYGSGSHAPTSLDAVIRLYNPGG